MPPDPWLELTAALREIPGSRSVSLSVELTESKPTRNKRLTVGMKLVILQV